MFVPNPQPACARNGGETGSNNFLGSNVSTFSIGSNRY